ncbi:MAG TPA: hypothetical protein VK348_07105 [Planctomycetota bacterium]|nr:hypothetical protein [Planctomycetota bacterium]
MNDTIEQAAELQMDALLHELAGELPAADLWQRVQATAGARQSQTARRRTRWLAAAVLIIGSVVVATVAFLRHGPPAARQAATPDLQEPQPPRDAPSTERDQQIAKAIRDLELPARRDVAIAALLKIGEDSLPALQQAQKTELGRGRKEVAEALQVAVGLISTTARKKAFGLPDKPITLIADYSDNRVVAVDDRGKVLWEQNEVYGAWDAEFTPAGTVLLTEFSVSSVVEVDALGNVVWSYAELKNPYRATRLANGHTLIADTFAGRVIEVTPAKQIVWKYDKEIRPFDVERLANGNTLIADVRQDRVIEVSPAGEIVWEVKQMNNVHDAERLANGNTLITLRSAGKVIEVDHDGKTMWQLDKVSSPSSAHRLANGNTLVAENGAVREFDHDRNVVWKKEMTWAVQARRY